MEARISNIIDYNVFLSLLLLGVFYLPVHLQSRPTVAYTEEIQQNIVGHCGGLLLTGSNFNVHLCNKQNCDSLSLTFSTCV